jgi:hypothetical protein
MLEDTVSSTLFPCENGVRFRKEYILKLSCFEVEICSVCFTYAYVVKLKKHIYHSKENYLY